MNVSSELLSVLMEIAILNYDKGFISEAETIFNALAYCRPKSGYPSIGKACVQMHKGDFESAIAILRNTSSQDYMEKELVDSYLGKALMLAGYNDEANNLLSHLSENGKYDIAVNFARDLLSENL
jgi:predicted Zn-dependent protease